MHVNTALGTLAHIGKNIFTHTISSGLYSTDVKETLFIGGDGDTRLTG